jgi:putative ABC transport system permease protein
MGQMFAESAFITVLALATGLGMLIVSEPLFVKYTGNTLRLDFLRDPQVIMGLIGLVVVISFVAGSYPAVVLSGMRAGSSIKASIHGAKNRTYFRTSLVVFQFVVSISLLVGTIVVRDQIDFMHEKDLGFESETLVVIENGDKMGSTQQAFKEQLLSINGVEKVALSSSVPGSPHSELFLAPGYADNDEQHNVYVNFADHDYAKVLNLELLAGRYHEIDRATDLESVVVNETLVRTMGFEGEPIGQEIKFSGQDDRYPIIGVVKDYNFQSLHTEIGPFAYFVEDETMSKMAIRVNTTEISSVLESIESTWKRFQPVDPIVYSFLDSRLDELYAAEEQTRKVMTAFAVLALLIAGLGLFGLSAFSVVQRTKEIGIRKVHGASVIEIVRMLMGDFARFAVIAFVIAAPLAWFGMSAWLENFAYRTDLKILTFFIAGAMAVSFALLAVVTQSLRAARANPVESLRYE